MYGSPPSFPGENPLAMERTMSIPVRSGNMLGTSPPDGGVVDEEEGEGTMLPRRRERNVGKNVITSPYRDPRKTAKASH